MDHAKAMTSTLCDQLFKHFPGVNSIPYLDSDLHLFIYIATEQYTYNKFYDIIIDPNASRHSTVSYGQYLAYQKDHDISFNIETEATVYI